MAKKSDLEAELRSRGLNPMRCLNPDHDCLRDPHFIVDTKDGRKEISPRSTHQGMTLEDLGISLMPKPQEKTPEQIRKENGPEEYLAFLDGHPYWSDVMARAGQSAWKAARKFYIELLLKERHGHCCALYVSCQACAIERVVRKMDPEYEIEGEGRYSHEGLGGSVP